MAYDLGHKPEEPQKVEKQEKYYPSLSFSTEEIPDLKGREVGDKVELHIAGEVKGMRENDKETSYDIEFQKCTMKKMSKEEYMSMSDEEKDRADKEEVIGEEEE